MSRLANLSWPRMRTGSKALRRRHSGSMFSMGWPLTLMRPRPCLAKAHAVAVFFLLVVFRGLSERERVSQWFEGKGPHPNIFVVNEIQCPLDAKTRGHFNPSIV